MTDKEAEIRAAGLVAGLGWDPFDAIEELKAEPQEVLVHYVRILAADAYEPGEPPDPAYEANRAFYEAWARAGIYNAATIFWKRVAGERVNMQWGERP